MGHISKFTLNFSYVNVFLFYYTLENTAYSMPYKKPPKRLFIRRKKAAYLSSNRNGIW